MTVVFLTSASTSPWPRPSDWINAGHTVELVGGGGSGAAGTTGSSGNGGGGGGGGAWGKITYSSGALGTTTAFRVGLGATEGNSTGTIWLNTTPAQPHATSLNGGPGSGTSAGGASSFSQNTTGGAVVYTTTASYAGGGGGSAGKNTGGAGGGGAAGPSGAGGTGTTTASTGGGGGGTANNGIILGGNGASPGKNSTGTAGGSSTLWTQTSDSATAGVGSGGGGSGADTVNETSTSTGGSGAFYGGGGGGCGYCRGTGSSFVVGVGRPGLIVITYTPVDVYGTLNATETGSDTASVSGSITISGSVGATETTSDSASVSGSVSSSGSLSATDTGPDTASVSGSVTISGSLSVTEVGEDSASVSGSVSISGLLSITEVGDDGASISGSISISGLLDATETGNDTATITGNVGTVYQAFVDIASGSIGNDILGGIVYSVDAGVESSSISGDIFCGIVYLADVAITAQSSQAFAHGPEETFFGESYIFGSITISTTGTLIPGVPAFGMYFARSYFGAHYFPIWFGPLSQPSPTYDADSNMYSTSFVEALAGIQTSYSADIFSTSYLGVNGSWITYTDSETISGSSTLTSESQATYQSTTLLESLSSIISASTAIFASDTIIQALSSTALTPLLTLAGQSTIAGLTEISGAGQRIRYSDTAIAVESAVATLGGAVLPVAASLDTASDLTTEGTANFPASVSAVDAASSLDTAATVVPSTSASLSASSLVSVSETLDASVTAQLEATSLTSTLAYVVAQTLVPIETLSTLTSTAERFRTTDTSIQDTSDITTSNTAVFAGIFDTLLAVSQITSNPAGLKPGQSDQITIASDISAVAKFIGRGFVDVNSISEIILDATELLSGDTDLFGSSLLTALATGYRPAASDTIQTLSDITADATVSALWGSQLITGTSQVTAEALRTADGFSDTASVSELTTEGVGFRPASTDLATLSSLTSEGTGYRPGIADTISGSSLVASLAVGYRPGALQPFDALSQIDSFADLIARTPVDIPSISALTSLGSRFRYGITSLQDSSEVHATASSTGTDITTTIQTLSYLASLAVGFRPAESDISSFADLSSLANLVAQIFTNIESSSDLTSDGRRVRYGSTPVENTTSLDALSTATKPALFDTFIATSVVTSLATGFRPAESDVIDTVSDISLVAAFIGKAVSDIASLSDVLSSADRLRLAQTAILDTSQITASGVGFRPGTIITLLASSAILALDIRLRPAVSEDILAASDIVSSATFRAKANSAIQSLSNLVSQAQLWRYGNSDINDTSDISVSATELRPALFDTFIAVSEVTASGLRIIPEQIDSFIVSSDIVSVAKFIGNGYSNLSIASAISVLPELYRRSPATLSSSTSMVAFDTANFVGVSGLVASASDLLVDAVVSQPRFSEVMLGTSFLATLPIFVGSGHTAVAPESSVFAGVHRNRPADVSLSASSELIADGRGYKPGLSDTITGVSFIDALARMLKPGQSQIIFGATAVGVFENFVGAARITAASTATLGVNPVGFRLASAALGIGTTLTAIAAGLKPDTTSLQSGSALVSLAKAKKPGQSNAILVSSSLSSLLKFIGKGRATPASLSTISTTAARFRAQSSTLASSSLLTSSAGAVIPRATTLLDTSVVAAWGRGRFRSRPDTLAGLSTIFAGARVRFSGRPATLSIASAVTTVANRVPSIQIALLSTSSVLSIASGLKPDSSDIQSNSVISALGRGKRPGEMLPVLPSSVVGVTEKLIRHGIAHPLAVSIVSADATRTRFAVSALASLSSVIITLEGQKLASVTVQDNSVLTVLGKGYKPGQPLVLLPSSTISLIVRLISRSTIRPSSTSLLMALANRIRPGRSALVSLSSVVPLGRGYRPALSNTITASTLLTVNKKYYGRARSSLNPSSALTTLARINQKDTPHLISVSLISSIGNRVARQQSYPFSTSAVVPIPSRMTFSLSDILSRSDSTVRGNLIARSQTLIDAITGVTPIPIFGSAGAGLSLMSSASSGIVNAKARFIDTAQAASASGVVANLRALRRARATAFSVSAIATSTAAIKRSPVSSYSASNVISTPNRWRTATTSVPSVSLLSTIPKGRYRSRVNLNSISYLDITGKRIRYGTSDIIRSSTDLFSSATTYLRPGCQVVGSSGVAARATVKRQANSVITSASVSSANPRGLFRDRIVIAAASASSETPIAKFRSRQNLVSYSFISPDPSAAFIDSATINATTVFLNLRGDHTAVVNSGIVSASDITPRGSLIPGGVGAVLDIQSYLAPNARGRFRDRPAISSTAAITVSGARKQRSTIVLQPRSAVSQTGTIRRAGVSELAPLSQVTADQKALRHSSVSISQPSHVRVIFYKATKPADSGIGSTSSLTINYKVTRKAFSAMLPYSATVAFAGRTTSSTTLLSSRSRLAALSQRVAAGHSNLNTVSSLVARARYRVRPHVAVTSLSAVQSDAYRTKYITATLASTSAIDLTPNLTARTPAPIYSQSTIESGAFANFVMSADINTSSYIRLRRTTRVRQAAALIQANSDLVIIGRMSPPIDSASLLIGL